MKIFVSSTYIDLKEHRKAVEEVIKRLDMQYSGMEYFASRPEEPKVAALQEIGKCDLFVGIYAHRYGVIPKGDTKSVTEQEYDHAQKLGLPCFCFRVNLEYQWPEKSKEKGKKRKLHAFLKRIDKRHLRDTFTTSDNLAMKVSTAISAWTLGKDVSQDDYLNFVAQQCQFIPTLDPNHQLTMDNFYITLQVGQEIRREQKHHEEGDERRMDKKGIATSLLAWRDKLRDGKDRILKPIKIEDALRQQRLIILGDPGSGKTTLLHYLAYKFAKREMPQQLLPIFVPLGTWAREKTDLLDIVVNWWCANETDEMKQQGKRALSNWLKTGECILLFDGLDEVGEASERTDIIRRIEALSGN